MAGTSYFHHALKFRKDICIGCSHCMTVCPCEAIRIKKGKASLLENRCVDCGQCYKACPVGAIIVEQDDFSRIFEFKNRVALVPTVLIGQFPEEVTQLQMYSVLMELGFTHIFEVEHGVEIVKPATEEYLDKRSSTKPLISSYCPAIVRLIQVKFPTLTNNLVLVKPPLDISATYIRKKLMDQGDPDELTGVFYITPCAAKIAAIKSPVGEETSPITGVINMDFIFNKVYTAVKQGFGGQKTCQVPHIQPISAEA
ncbi:MAG: 4Fe-4S binding protein, partial [Bacteroidales bacterium]|nr:4Fe-4S binding protein [Bacteroidales bacterium]